MRQYTVKDNSTGRLVTFDWGEEYDPTDADLEEVFAAADQFPIEQPKPNIPANIAGTGDQLFAAINKSQQTAPAPMGMGDVRVAQAGKDDARIFGTTNEFGAALNKLNAPPPAPKIEQPPSVFDASTRLANASALDNRGVQDDSFVNPQANQQMAAERVDEARMRASGQAYLDRLKQEEDANYLAGRSFSPGAFVEEETGVKRGAMAPVGDVVDMLRRRTVGMPRQLLEGSDLYYGRQVENARDAAHNQELLAAVEAKEKAGLPLSEAEAQAKEASGFLETVKAIPAGIAQDPWEFIESMADPIGYLAGAGLGKLRALAATAKTAKQAGLISEAQKALNAAEATRLGRGGLAFGEQAAGNLPFDVAQGQANFQDATNPGNYAPTLALSTLSGGAAALRNVGTGTAPRTETANATQNILPEGQPSQNAPVNDLLGETLDRRFAPSKEEASTPQPELVSGNSQPATMPEVGEAATSPARAPELTDEQARGRQEWETVLRSFYAPDMAEAALQVVDSSVRDGAMPADVFTRAKIQIKQGTPTIIEDGQPVSKIVPMDDDAESSPAPITFPESGNRSNDLESNSPEIPNSSQDVAELKPVPVSHLKDEFQKRFSDTKRNAGESQGGILPVIKSIGKIKLTEDVRRQFGIVGKSLKQIREEFGDVFTSETDTNGKSLGHISDAINERIESGQVRSPYGVMDEAKLVDIIGYDEYNMQKREGADPERQFNESVFSGEIDNFRTVAVPANKLPQYFTASGEVFVRVGKNANDGFLKFKDSANRTYQFGADQPIRVDEIQGRAQLIKPFEPASFDTMRQGDTGQLPDENDSSMLDAFAQRRQPGENVPEVNRPFIKIGRDRIRKLEQTDLFGGKGLVAHNTAVPKSTRVDDLEGTALFRAADDAQNAKAMEGQQSLFQKEVSRIDPELLMKALDEQAQPWRTIEPKIESWKADFPNNRVNTPIGEIKIGENQFEKLMSKNRLGFAGLVKPTLETPSFVLQKPGGEKLFIRAFEQKGRAQGFMSVTIPRDGTDIMISAYARRKNSILRDLKENEVIYNITALDDAAPSSPITSSLESGQARNKLSQVGGEVKGQTVFDGAKNTAVIELFKGNADLSTFLHEYSHLLRRWALKAEDEAVVARWLEREGLIVANENGAWTRAAEERFARGFERYLREGWAADGALKEVFAKIKNWMREIYLTIRGTELDGTIPEDVRKVYDRLLGVEQNGNFYQDGKNSGPELLHQKNDITESDNFKRWFGNSQIIDKNGNPLVVYHGTNANFNEFSKTKIIDPERGFFFTNDKKSANIYGSKNVMPVYLRIFNPFKISAEDWHSGLGIGATDLKNNGYDGIVIKYQNGKSNYIVLEPTQIKSATGNRGTFDPNDANILRQENDPMDSELLGTRKAEELAKEKSREKKLSAINENVASGRKPDPSLNNPPAKVGPTNWPEGMERFKKMKEKDPYGLKGVVSYKPGDASKESGFLNRLETFKTNFINQARPLEVLQSLFEKDQGRTLNIKEDLRYAVNRVMGAGGTANLYIDKHFAPIYRGGELRLWDGKRVNLDRLSPHEQRLLDKYLLAKDSYWRSENNPEFENPMLNPQEARDWLTAHDKLPESLRNKLESRAQFVWQYWNDIASKKLEVGLWSQDEFTRFTQNPFYIPEDRDWNAVLAANLDAKSKKQFTSTNKLIRGTNSDEWAPVFDPVTAAVAETHLLVSEAAKLGIMHRIIDMAEKSQAVGNWVQAVDADYQPEASEAIVKVLRPRDTVLPPHLKVRAEAIQKLKSNLKALENDESADALKRQRERIKAKLTRTMQGKVSEEKLAKTLESVEAGRQKYRNQKRVEYQKKLETEESILRMLPAAHQKAIEQWFKEGDIRTYVVPKELGDAINGMGPLELGTIEKLVVPFASLFRRAQVGWNPDFTMANAPRDYQEAFFNTGVASPKWAFRGLMHFLKQDEFFERYMQAGGAMGGNEAGFRKAANRGESVRYGDRLLADRFNKVKDKWAYQQDPIRLAGKEIDISELARMADGLKQAVTTPFAMSEALNEVIEMATRLGIFDYMTAKGLSDSEAAHAGRHGTLDFGRVGAKVKGWNAMIPFLNASIQGMDRMVRAWKEDPKGSALRFAMVSAVPTLALLAWNTLNPHYAEIPAQEKEYYWILMAPNGNKYLKVAKGHLTKLAVNPLQMMAENKLGTAKKDFWKIAAGTLALALPVSDAQGLIPQPIQEVGEQIANYDYFFDREIVRDENLPAGYQADPNTAETLKAVGRALNLSPARMQHALQSALGGTSTNILWAMDFALGKTGVLPSGKIPVENRPFVKRVFGLTQEWKSDLLREQRLAMAELRDAQKGLGVAARKGTGPNAMDAQALKGLTAAQAEKVKKASERVKAISDAIKKNEPLRRALEAREKAESK